MWIAFFHIHVAPCTTSLEDRWFGQVYFCSRESSEEEWQNDVETWKELLRRRIPVLSLYPCRLAKIFRDGRSQEPHKQTQRKMPFRRADVFLISGLHTHILSKGRNQ